MPTYLYRCTTCGTQAEVVQSFSEATLTSRVCEACGTEQPTKKVFTPVGVTFKGSGFYKTDSRSGSGSSGAKAEKAASSEGSSSGSGSSSGDGGSSSSGSGSSSGGSAGAASAPAASTAG